MDISDWAKNLVERVKKVLQEKRTKDEKLYAQLEKSGQKCVRRRRRPLKN
jgi:hypothetical protein